MDWQSLKENARLWFGKAGTFALFQIMFGYLVACVSAGHPVTLNQYANFVSLVLNGWKTG